MGIVPKLHINQCLKKYFGRSDLKGLRIRGYGDVVSELLDRREMKREALIDQTGIPQPDLSFLENHSDQYVFAPEKLIAVAYVLQVELEEIADVSQLIYVTRGGKRRIESNPLHRVSKRPQKFANDETDWQTLISMARAYVGTLSTVHTYDAPEESKEINKAYIPVKVIHGKSVVVVRSVDDLVYEKPTVLIGTIGQGKTLLAQLLAVDAVHNRGMLPIYLDSSILKQFSIQEFCRFKISQIASHLADREILRICQSERLLVILDGIDELSPPDRRRVLAELEGFTSSSNRSRILLTSRPLVGLSRIAWLNKRWIAPLEDVWEFSAHLLEDAALSEFRVAFDLLRSTYRTHLGTFETRMFLAWILEHFRKSRNIHVALERFYENSFELCFRTQNSSVEGLKRRPESGLDQSVLRRLFATICYLTLNKCGCTTSITLSVLEEIVADAAAKEAIACETRVLIDDIERTTNLLRVQQSGRCEFVSQSLMVSYAAAYVREKKEPQREKIYQELTEADHRFFLLGKLFETDRENWIRHYGQRELAALTWQTLAEYFNDVTSLHFEGLGADIVAIRVELKFSVLRFFMFGCSRSPNAASETSIEEIEQCQLLDSTQVESLRINGSRITMQITRANRESLTHFMSPRCSVIQKYCLERLTGLRHKLEAEGFRAFGDALSTMSQKLPSKEPQ